MIRPSDRLLGRVMSLYVEFARLVVDLCLGFDCWFGFEDMAWFSLGDSCGSWIWIWSRFETR